MADIRVVERELHGEESPPGFAHKLMSDGKASGPGLAGSDCEETAETTAIAANYDCRRE